MHHGGDTDPFIHSSIPAILGFTRSLGHPVCDVLMGISWRDKWGCIADFGVLHTHVSNILTTAADITARKQGHRSATQLAQLKALGLGCGAPPQHGFFLSQVVPPNHWQTISKPSIFGVIYW